MMRNSQKPSEIRSSSPKTVTGGINSGKTLSYGFFLRGGYGRNPDPESLMRYRMDVSNYIVTNYSTKDLEFAVDITNPRLPTLQEVAAPTLVLPKDIPLPEEMVAEIAAIGSSTAGRASARASSTTAAEEQQELLRQEKQREALEYQKAQAAHKNQISMKTWERESGAYDRKKEKLEQEAVNLYGLMVSTMTLDSLNMCETTEKGRDAKKSKDPSKLFSALLSTHLLSSAGDKFTNLVETENRFNNLSHQRDAETLIEFKVRYDAALAAYTEAAKRCDAQSTIPNEERQALRFIMYLINKKQYGDFVTHCQHQKAYPKTISDAITEATEFGRNKFSPAQKVAAAATMQHAGGGKRKAESDNRGKRTKASASVKLNGACAKCHKSGHMARDCTGAVCPGCGLEGCRETLEQRKQIDQAIRESKAGK
jgi:hypothetical protein